MDRSVIDASVVIASLLPDEPYRDASLRILRGFLSGNMELITVPLLRFEITNALWKAISRGRVDLKDAQAALREFDAFNLPEYKVPIQEVLKTAHTYNRSAYDAAYLTLAKIEHIPLVTADKRLYSALRDRLPWLVWVKDALHPGDTP